MWEKMSNWMPEDIPHRLAESVPENIQDRIFERNLPIK